MTKLKRYQVLLDPEFFKDLKTHPINKYARTESEVIRNILNEFQSSIGIIKFR